MTGGYTKIDNVVLERLCKTKFSPNQTKVLIAIIRRTLGYHRPMNYVAQSEIAKMTGLDRRLVHRAMMQLKEIDVIARDGEKIGLSPRVLKRLSSVEMTTAIAEDDDLSSAEMHIKDNNINKETTNNQRASNETIDKTRKDLVEKGVIPR